MEQHPKTLEYYKRLPYRLHAYPMQDSDDSNYWIAEYVELRGCKTDGLTEGEAIVNVQELFDEYILDRIENQVEIPEPKQPGIVEKEKELWVTIKTKPTFGSNPRQDLQETEATKSIKYEEIAV